MPLWTCTPLVLQGSGFLFVWQLLAAVRLSESRCACCCRVVWGGMSSFAALHIINLKLATRETLENFLELSADAVAASQELAPS